MDAVFIYVANKLYMYCFKGATRYQTENIAECLILISLDGFRHGFHQIVS